MIKPLLLHIKRDSCRFKTSKQDNETTKQQAETICYTALTMNTKHNLSSANVQLF